MNAFSTIVVFVAVAVVSSQNCPPGVAVSMCLSDPCHDAECPAVPWATCRVSYCGGCFAHFYMEDDIRVDCDPYHPRIDRVHFRTQGEEGVIEADKMKMTVHHKEE